MFEELLVLTCGMALLKERRSQGAGRVMDRGRVEDFLALLPFAPTGAQRRAMADIAADLASGRAMNRLVQGDVGSGKTGRCRLRGLDVRPERLPVRPDGPHRAAGRAARPDAGRPAWPRPGVRVGLLTGSVKGRRSKTLLSNLRSGEVDVVVGTHALFSQGVEYADLGLVIADEQHRFGVAQRTALAEKGEHPHTLVMLATPIPRTLALILYGDLDVSVIDQLPPAGSL